MMSPKTQVKLNTLSDYNWFLDFSNKDRKTFNVHSVTSVFFGDILKKLGYPIDPLFLSEQPSKSVARVADLHIIMRYSLPEACDRFVEQLQSEFGWQSPPTLLNASSLE